ncbi:MAG: hypothetical protein J6D16_01755 [Clostridia bacterium]|nr:hypothetical protein [Clostridia bacterium]
MKNSLTRCLTVALLVLALVVSFAACGKDPADTTAPDTTVPEVTTPEDTEPEVTTPEETEPEGTVPEETLPEETLPDETLPSESEPAATEPEETTPAETTPAGEGHRHQFTMTQTFPNCTTAGTKMYVCSCGEMYELEGEAALGHAWALIDTVPATCAVAGYDVYKCVSCGETERRLIPQTPHTFTVSAAIFPTSALRAGDAFELLVCETCDIWMTKVDANHQSGHFFVTQEDGSGLCACGAIANATTATLGTMDFASGTQGKNIVVSNGVKVADGKWVVSQSTQQAFLHYDKNPDLATALTGTDADGNLVKEIVISFELAYTGTYEKNLNFLNLLGNSGFLASIYFGTDDEGHLALYDGAKGEKTVLTADETYLVKYILVPSTGVLKATVEGGDLAERVTLFEVTASQTLSTSKQFGLARPEFACGENEDYAIYVDNMSIDLMALVFDPTSTEDVVYCDHDFITESVVDLYHPAEEQWIHTTCSVCERLLETQACELVGEHIFAKEPTTLLLSTCVTEGTATYACLICGEEVSETLPLSDHTFMYSTTVFETSSLYNQPGYELLGCRDCKEMILAPANHESGHCFTEQTDGSYLCACGAKASGIKTTVGTMDFTTDKVGENIAFDTTLTVTDGKWAVSNSWRQHFLHYAANPVLSKALSGVDANGEPIESFAITFDLTYTGAYNKNLNFINILGDKDFLASIYFGTDAEGHLALYDGAKGEKTILTAGETYKVSFILLPATNSLKATVEGGDLAEKVTLYDKKVSQTLATTKQIGLSRAAFGVGEGEDYTIAVDNMAFVSTALTLDESTVDDRDLCTHIFSAAEDGFLCILCGRFLAREDCDTVGHLLFADTVEAAPSTCVTAGYEKHTCVLCGEIVTVSLPLGDHEIPTEPTFIKESTCTVPGYREYKCANCEYTEKEELALLPHTYNVSTGVVTAKDDPVGEGYELFACSCGDVNLKKVIANHESGHFFTDGVCACGAKLVSGSQTVATNDFTSWTGNSISVRGGSASCIDGKFRLSTVNTHAYIDKDGDGGNVILYDMLDGSYGGATFDIIELAFDLSYTGTMPASIDSGLRTVFSWRDPASNQLINVYLKQDEGALVVYGENGEAIIASDRDWRITVTINLKENTASVTLSGNGIQPAVLTNNYKPAQSISNLGTIFLTRSQQYIAPENGAIYMDNLTLSYTATSVDTSAVNTDYYCEHSFTKTAIVTDEILEADKWFRYTCSECGGTYTSQEAKHIVIGQLDYTDKTSLWNPIFRISKITEAMLVDGKFKVSTTDGLHLATANDNPHVAALFDGVDEDGSRISRITLSYDFSYTGKLSFSAANSGNNYVFVNLMHNANGGDLGFAVELRATEDGKAVVNGKNSPDKKLVLDPGKDYTFRIHLDPGTKRISCTVSGADMSETELFSLTSTASFTNFLQFAFSRATYNATKNGNGFELFFDNISLAYDKVAK